MGYRFKVDRSSDWDRSIYSFNHGVHRMSNVERRNRSRISVAPTLGRKRLTHVRPQAPDIDLNGPGRLRTKHVLALFGFCHSTLYSRMDAGEFPKPDGQDGRILYWNTETIRERLIGNANGLTSQKMPLARIG